MDSRAYFPVQLNAYSLSTKAHKLLYILHKNAIPWMNTHQNA